MLDELLSNDGRAEKFWPRRDSKRWPPDAYPNAVHTRLSVLIRVMQQTILY